MSNLASMIMEGTGYIGSGSLKHHYDHVNGAGLIAMESAEALRDIFEAEFYIPNSNTIRATLEGYNYDSVMEAKEGGVFDRIKKFFINLKEKVKEFFHNVKRYLLGVFADDATWVGKYEKELTALKSEDLKDYKIKMYDYSELDDRIKNIDKLPLNMDDILNMTMNTCKTTLKDISDTVNKGGENIYASDDKIEQLLDTAYQKNCKDILGSDYDEDDLTGSIWSHLRGGATNENDKEEVDVGTSEIRTYIDEIKNSNKIINKLNNLNKDNDKVYNKSIKWVDDAKKECDNAKENPNNKNTVDLSNDVTYMRGSGTTAFGKEKVKLYSNYLSKYSTFLSKQQSFMNQFVTGMKTAYNERNKSYKGALTGAFAYAKKQRKLNKK